MLSYKLTGWAQVANELQCSGEFVFELQLEQSLVKFYLLSNGTLNYENPFPSKPLKHLESYETLILTQTLNMTLTR